MRSALSSLAALLRATLRGAITFAAWLQGEPLDTPVLIPVRVRRARPASRLSA